MKLDGSKLINARLSRGWTQSSAAVAAGVSLPTYNRAENGKGIQPPKAKAICDALSLPLSGVMIPVESEISADLPEPLTAAAKHSLVLSASENR